MVRGTWSSVRRPPLPRLAGVVSATAAWAERTTAAADGRLGVSRLVPDTSDAVIMYHSVGDPEKYGNVGIDRLRRDVEYFTDRYDVVDLPGVLDGDTGGKQIALTFDDAFGNFYRNALPILREHDVPATLFVTAGFVGGDDADRLMECHLLDDVDGDTMMSDGELCEVGRESNVTLGNHTMTHPDVSEIADDGERHREIIGAKRELERRFGVEIRRFCFPYGGVDRRSLDLVKEGHDVAVTARPGLVPGEVNGDGAYLLPRLHGHQSDALLRWDATDLRWRLASFPLFDAT